MNVKLKLGLWALSITAVTLSAAYADVALIGPDERVVLFYKNSFPTPLGPWRKEAYGPHLKVDREGHWALRKDAVWVLQNEDPLPREEVAIRYYEDLCILPDDENATRDDIDCDLKSDTAERHILSPAFRAQLGTAFKVVGDRGYYPTEAIADREIFKHRQMTPEEIEKNIHAKLRAEEEDIERREAFAQRYGQKMIQQDKLAQLRQEVQELAHDQLIQEETLPQVTKRFRAAVTDLYNKIGDERIHILKVHPDEKDFQAALLDAFLLLPNIDDKFVPIKAGKFKMGSSPESYGHHYDTEHAVYVTITHDFEMMATEVTQGEWYMIMGENPSPFNQKEYCPEQDQYLKIGNVELCLNLPVTNVSYDDIQTFIRRVAASNSNYLYRLPTEAEWAYAASEGGKAWGHDVKELNANWRIFAQTDEGKSFLRKLDYRFPPFSAGNYVWHKGNSEDQPHQIATKSPNGWGLYDMFGNVAEFTDSDFRPKALGGEDPNFRFVEQTGLVSVALGHAKKVMGKKFGQQEDQEDRYYGKAIRGESFNFSFAEPPRPETKDKNKTSTIDDIVDMVKTTVDPDHINPLWRNFRISTRGHYLPNTTDKRMFDVGFRLVRIAKNKGQTMPKRKTFFLKSVITAKKEQTSNADQPASERTPKDKLGNGDVTSTNVPAKRPQMLTSDFGTTINTNSALTDEDLAQEADDQVEEKKDEGKKNRPESSPDAGKGP